MSNYMKYFCFSTSMVGAFVISQCSANERPHLDEDIGEHEECENGELEADAEVDAYTENSEMSVDDTDKSICSEFRLPGSGIWCWFQDERAIIVGDQLLVGSVDNAGSVVATVLDLKSGEVTTTVLQEDFGKDDHDAPAIVVRSDGRIIAFYTGHSRDTSMYYRISSEPYSALEWNEIRLMTPAPEHTLTYANPHRLAAEGKLFLFWRGIETDATCSISADDGETWGEAFQVIKKENERPYVKYVSNGIDTIHFAFTEAHPDTYIKTSLYHAYYRAGALYRSDGGRIGEFVDGLTPTEATLVYDGNSNLGGEAWVHDIALDSAERPVIGYATVPSSTDHRYRYARWEGASWIDREIAKAGNRLYQTQKYYSGGIAVDPDDTRVVYISSDVDPVDGSPNASGHYEVKKGVTSDGGDSWSWELVTSESSEDNLRPIVPAGHPGDTFVLWFRGRYTNYQDYYTEVVLCTDADIPIVSP